jgi:pimeloyl-ACP methyl ester carboxylesterase
MPLYLHGFASSPASAKARAFVERGAALGLDLTVPALDEGDFEHLTVTRMRALVERLAAAEPAPRVLIGSSLGGYLAALHASRHPVDALVLMAPAVDFSARLTRRLTAEEHAGWRDTGSVLIDHFGAKAKLPLSFEFLRDAPSHEPFPQVSCPTLVLQGRRDEVVPLAAVSRWAARQADARLVTFDSGHELTDVVDDLLAETVAFLASLPALRARWPKLGEAA